MKFFKGFFISLPIALVLWFIAIHVCFGATYYVDSASSGGNGTTSAISGVNAAWATFVPVNAASFSAGDSILIKRESVFYSPLIVPSSGSVGSPITFDVYGTGAKPQFLMSNGIIGASWSKTGGQTYVYEAAQAQQGDIDAVWASTWGTVFEDVEWMLKGASIADVDSTAGSCYYDTSARKIYIHPSDNGNPITNGKMYRVPLFFYAVSTNGKAYVDVKNMNLGFVAYANFLSFDFSSYPYVTSDHVNITAIDAFGTPHNAFSIIGTNIVLDGCATTWTMGDNADFAVADLGASQDRATDTVTVRNCTAGNEYAWGSKPTSAFTVEFNPSNVTFTDNAITGSYKHGFSNWYDSAPTNVVIDGLTVTGTISDQLIQQNLGTNLTIKRVNATGTIAKGLYANAITGLTIERNYIKSAEWGIILGASNAAKLDYNVLKGTTGGIWLSDGTGQLVYNNTIDGGLIGIRIDATPAGSASTKVKNNIIINATNGNNVGAATLDIDYNMEYGCTYWGTNLDLATYQGLGLDTHSVTINPKFKSSTDYHLIPGSPAINAGMTTGLTEDFDGKGVPYSSATDIGAYEYRPTQVHR
jgi:parallel beta-helix repeat protein